ncbi:MAG: hypothetical protein QHG99_04805 [Methanomicrobiales archaeon]|nr:hypothetical protein [Methanomicrobiales archaeon]
MTVRVNAHHIICPGCQEKVFLDELVGGHCPLCGCVMEDEVEDDYGEVIERSDLAWIVFQYHIFRKLSELGVAPLQIMQLLRRMEDLEECDLLLEESLEFAIEVPMSRVGHLIPKRCSKCGRIFVGGGRKVILADLGRNQFRKSYRCSECQEKSQ